jgi:hypothetical protein
LALDEMNNACFIVRDKNGQALGYSRTSPAFARWRSFTMKDFSVLLDGRRSGGASLRPRALGCSS